MTLVRRVALVVVPLALGVAMPAQGMTCSTGSAVSNPSANPGLVADCTVLLAAKEQLGGILNWRTGLSMTEWEGVTLGGSPARVTRLILRSKRLNGSIPSELSELSKLRYLNLGLNRLTGSVPSELGGLTNLERLGLYENRLQGSIPSWIGNLTNLEFLYLGNSGLSGSIPSWLGNLTRLTTLSLRNMGLTGQVPADLGRLTDLDYLYLDGNNLSGCVPGALAIGLVYHDIGDLEFCNSLGRPDAPELTDASGRTLLTTWSPPANTGPPISGYDVEYRRYETSDSYTLSSYGSTARSTRITGLALGTWYEVRVRARNADGPGPWSDLERETTLAVLAIPTRMSAPRVTAGGRTLRVAWTAPANPALPITGYDVAYRRRGTTRYTETPYGGTTTSATLWVSSNTTYEVRVRANNADGPGAWSAVTTATTSRVRPGKPAAPDVLPGGWGSVRVTWSAPANSGPSISDYDVQYRQAGSTDEFSDAGFNGTTRKTTISGLTNGTRYEVQVRARNYDGTGSWSDSGAGRASAALEYGSETYTATEGGPAVAVTVTLNEAAEEAVTIPITVTAGAATEAGDYDLSGLSGDGSVTFLIGESSKTLTVTANEDSDSADETVKLGFGTLPDAVGAGMRPTALVALADNDPLTVTLSGPEGPVEGPFEVAVTFSEELTGFDADDVTVSGGTVTVSGSGAQYTATVVPGGAETVTVDVQAGAVQDDAGNGNEASQRYSVTVHYTCSTGAAVTAPADNAKLVEDCETLLEAKEELAGTARLNWSAALAMRSWDGVTISGTTDRVSNLRLANRGLNGTLPAELSELAGLTTLQLSSNSLTGSIPEELADLENLLGLYLGNNGLTGSIPTALGRLAELRQLVLTNNDLSGGIPSDLGDASNLNSLQLDDNDLRGNFPSELGNLRSLLVLDVSGNRLSGCVPASLRARLSSVSLGTLRFCDRGPGKPEPPQVEGAGSGTLAVSWEEPANTGAAIGDYDVQYREAGSEGGFIDARYDGTVTQTRISGLTPATSYEVQVRATSADGTGPWSEAGVGDAITAAVGYGAERYTAVEGGAAAAVTVSLSAAAMTELTIPITESATGTEAGDYTLSAQELTFAVGVITRTLTVTANDDDDSADEAVELGFGELPAGVITDTPATTIVALSDNDPLTATLSGPSGTVEGPFEVTVTFTEEVTGFDAAAVQVAGGTAAVSGSGARYTARVRPTASGTLTVDVPAGAVQDAAGNDNEAAQQFRVTVKLTCSGGVAVPSPARNPRLVEDCETLLDAKDALAGTGELNWSVDEAMSSWDGVTTGGTPRRVTRLHLTNRELNGSIPASLSNLTRLTRLFVERNDLSGSIPSELGGVTTLTLLDISDNDLSGNVPGELGDLTNLYGLYLQNNRLTGCVPASLKLSLGGYDLGDLGFCDEGPGKPERPSVQAGGAGILVVSWAQPVNTGAAITDYDVQYRQTGSAGDFIDAEYNGTAREAPISGLPVSTSYEVQVRATSADGTGPWSESGEGETRALAVSFAADRYTAVEEGVAAAVAVELSEAALEEVAVSITVRPAALTEVNDYGLTRGR